MEGDLDYGIFAIIMSAFLLGVFMRELWRARRSAWAKRHPDKARLAKYGRASTARLNARMQGKTTAVQNYLDDVEHMEEEDDDEDFDATLARFERRMAALKSKEDADA